MASYKETKETLLEILKDNKWYTIDELQKKCEDYGLNFEEEKGRAPIYTSLYQLKKRGKIESDTKGRYRKSEKKQSNTAEDAREKKGNASKNEKLQEAIEIIEMQMKGYKNFDWCSCSDEELQEARCAVKLMKSLSRKIQNTFNI